MERESSQKGQILAEKLLEVDNFCEGKLVFFQCSPLHSTMKSQTPKHTQVAHAGLCGFTIKNEHIWQVGRQGASWDNGLESEYVQSILYEIPKELIQMREKNESFYITKSYTHSKFSQRNFQSQYATLYSLKVSKLKKLKSNQNIVYHIILSPINSLLSATWIFIFTEHNQCL